MSLATIPCSFSYFLTEYRPLSSNSDQICYAHYMGCSAAGLLVRRDGEAERHARGALRHVLGRLPRGCRRIEGQWEAGGQPPNW